MSQKEQSQLLEKSAPSPKPEGVVDPTAGTGQAIEPEAMRNLAGGAKEAGDKMWGPAGTPDTDGRKST